MSISDTSAHVAARSTGRTLLGRVVHATVLGLSGGAGIVGASYVALAFTVGGFAEARDTIANRLGIIPSYTIRERYRMSVGVDNLGNYLPDRQVEEFRQHYVMPAYYGSLFEIETIDLGDETRTVLWFTDEDGFIRNAIIDPSVLLRIETLPVDRYQVDPVEGGQTPR